ncbi:PIR Superfamily Protein [Plasmodium ovale wallikeri]|uniref:PIR Superfamily Protein n=1 Tax=Plasmodium ovale wallikeri TaxID=864142 RepID=A0A1A9ALH8_PLAOA|nr:PIR Superfamily Protein [Plasmodium ovale wallikeri]SBT56935.1 PIR Superfamily Protein [Plasmodium ovale wallikeri]
MSEEISIDNLPSKKYYNELKKCIEYQTIDDIINKEKPISTARTWVSNFYTSSFQYLNIYPSVSSDKNSSKRCRDFVFMLNTIKGKINKSALFQGDTYVNDNIDNFMDPTLKSYGYDNCSTNLSTYEEDTINNSKRLDDLCEDATYVESKHNDINSSSNCKDIKNHFIQEISELKAYNLDFLEYYDFSSFDELEGIIQKIKCNSDHAVGSSLARQGTHETYQFPVKYIPIVLIISLMGILFILFFLYKNTPVGPWLKTKIKKKMKIWNILSNEVENEMLEENSEYIPTKSHNEYNVLYNP